MKKIGITRALHRARNMMSWQRVLLKIGSDLVKFSAVKALREGIVAKQPIPVQ